MYRKVLKWDAEKSPNVRLARAQQANGREPTGEVVVQGVLTWQEYCERRQTWDAVRATVGLDAEFYVGAEVLLFPPTWLAKARKLADNGYRAEQHLNLIPEWSYRKAKGIGVDPAEGGDSTAMAAVDEYGLIELVSRKTPDTSVVIGEVVSFMRKWSCPPERVCFDRGGGGKEHADRMKMLEPSFKVIRTVGFGEPPRLDLKRGLHLLTERKDVVEERYAYKTLHCQMYHELSQLMELDEQGSNLLEGFTIPQGAIYDELCRQLAVYQKLTDEMGRYLLPPKHKRDKKDTRQTLTDMLGRSPDEADAVVLAYHAMRHKSARSVAQGF